MRLVPLERCHLPLTVGWRNDRLAQVHLRTVGLCTLEHQTRWWESLQEDHAPHRYWLAELGDRAVGYGGLTYMGEDRTAEVAWLLEPGLAWDRPLLRLLVGKAVEAGLRLLYSQIRPSCPVQRFLALQAVGFHGSPHRLILTLD